jgi:hypothetical protein
MYLKGQGVPQDDAEALKWFRKLAAVGDVAAQGNLGFMYLNGRGVPQDDAEALKWFRKAAEKGDYYSLNCLGFMYSKGRGVPQDYIQAYMWYTVAASPNPYIAGRDAAIKRCDFVASSMYPAQIAEAQRLVQECIQNRLQAVRR